MAEIKTRQTQASVTDFLDKVENVTRRKDSYLILKMMEEVTGLEPKMWGDAIVGFGSYHYKYETGHEGDMPLIGFSPRKQALTLYLMPGHEENQDLLSTLGKHKLGKSCLYINKLTDVDLEVLTRLVKRSYEAMLALNK